jgi:hypothetical protein
LSPTQTKAISEKVVSANLQKWAAFLKKNSEYNLNRGHSSEKNCSLLKMLPQSDGHFSQMSVSANKLKWANFKFSG